MSTFTTTRSLQAEPSAVFAAIKDPARLAKWWGPNGFTNRFEVFEFRPGGKWVFNMIGPDGKIYPNESVFVNIEADRQVVIQHTCEPHFTLTITLEPSAGGTLVRWMQAFVDASVASAVRYIVVPANEQNLDRLSAEVCHSNASAAMFDLPEFKAVCPVYCKSSTGIFEHVGSGVLLALNGMPLFLTAAHVADHAGNSLLFIPSDNGFRSVAGRFCRTALPPSGSRDDDRRDIAFCRLTEDTVDHINPAFDFLTEEDCDLDAAAEKDRLFTFSGFPWRKTTYDQSRTTSETEFFSFSGTSVEPDIYLRHGYTPDDNIVIKFRRKKSLDMTMQRRISPLPHGISGGAVYCWDKPSKERQPSPRIKLCGICTAYHAQDHIMVGTRLLSFLRAIHDNIAFILPEASNP